MTPVNLMEQTGHGGAITSELWLRCKEFADILMDQSQCPVPQLFNQKMDLPYLRLHGTQQHLLLMNGKPEMHVSQTSFGHISINSLSILTVSMAMESP